MGVVMMQMLLDRVPPHHNPPTDGTMPRGIFTDGCKNIQDVRDATLAITPPFKPLLKRLPLLGQLLQRVLNKDVSERPCARQALQDVWFQPSLQSAL